MTTTIATWFLAYLGGIQYIGPLSESACHRAAIELRAEGVTCIEATAFKACPVPDRPGTFTTCPVFDFPRVTRKP